MGNTKVQKFFFYIMLLIMAVSITVPSICMMTSKTPKALNGIMDLRNWNTDKAGTIPLNGEWEFYFGQLLYPDDFKSYKPLGRTIQKVPSEWSQYKFEGERLPSYGTATYRLKILLPNGGGNYGIKITCICSSARIFADNQQILVCGNPGESFETTKHKCYADTGYFSTDKAEVELLVQVANYTYTKSGICYEIHFGSQQSAKALRIYNLFLDTALIFGMFFISLYFFGIGLQRKNNRGMIFIAVYCFLSAIHEGFRSEAIFDYFFPTVSFDFSAKVSAVSYMLCAYSLIRFVYFSIKASFSRRANILIDAIGLTYLLLILFTDFYLRSYSYIIIIVSNIYAISLLLQIIFKHIHTKIEGRYYLYIAIISSAILSLTSLLNIVLLWESNIFIPVFQPIFVLSFSLYMSEKYENSYKTIEMLSEKLSVLDKLKDDFLAKTSHELKTPLNGVINISQSLLNGAGGSLNTAQAEDIQLILSIGKRLSTLVYDILDYSKLKVMDIKLNIICLDVHQVVESTVEIFRYLIKGRPITLENKIPPNEYMVLADENRLKQIITNLLDNSIKFTAEGSISTDCRQDGEFLWIEIRDTGIGIPESKLKDIFTSYEQVEEQSTGSGGTGLGLAITKQLVELHQGRIFAQSEPGQGACFTFSIPLVKDNKLLEKLPDEHEEYSLPQPLTIGNLPHTVNVGGKFSILAVDDEYSNLKALMNILTVCKYNVTIAGNAESALYLLKVALKYDLCILDVMMPGMSGYEACRKIREVYSPLELPVLLLTAKALPEDLEAGFMAGANDFIEKPFEIGELKCRVNTLVQLKKSMDLLLEKETAFLQAQIRPHFLFNALNTISSFCYTNPAKAGELLSELGVF
ncbi:MAG TPA: regulator, partial [Ruminiclostridium sp.]|nr:regulator [Ruminiclostridium sp.]